ncbi:unnamed protein product, partial [Lymnaea stagnalis]
LAPHVSRSRRSYLDNRVDTFPEHRFHPAQRHQDFDHLEFPFQRAAKPAHAHNMGFSNPGFTGPEYASLGLSNRGFTRPEFANPEFQNPEFVSPGLTNAGRALDGPQEELFTPLRINRFKDTPLDIGLAPEGEDDLEMEELEELLTRPLSPNLDLSAPAPQELMKKTKGSLDDYLDFMELRGIARDL